MAGDWIKWPKGLVDKPKVMQIAKALGVSQLEAACLCMEVWEWFDDYAEDGHAPGVTLAMLESLPGHAGIVKAMADVGWIIESGEGVDASEFFRRCVGSATRKRSRLGLKRGCSNGSETHQGSASEQKTG